MNQDTAEAELSGTIASKRDLAGELRLLIRDAENRAGRRINRVQLARRIHVSRPSLYAYLNGTTLPTSTTLDALLLALGVPNAQMRRLADARDHIEDSSRGRMARPPHQTPARSTDAPLRVPAPGTAPSRTSARGRARTLTSRDRTLAALPRTFVGRTSEIARLDALLRSVIARSSGPDWAETPRQRASTIATVTGPRGTGKTALAVHWARRTAKHFPDGQIHLDLHGSDEQQPPVSPYEALGRFLRALGIPVERIPPTLQTRIGLYRSLLSGRHILIILDDARDAEQVRPLLPVTSGCLTLVTSRTPLATLSTIEGAHRIELTPARPAPAGPASAAPLGTDRPARSPHETR